MCFRIQKFMTPYWALQLVVFLQYNLHLLLSFQETNCWRTWSRATSGKPPDDVPPSGSPHQGLHVRGCTTCSTPGRHSPERPAESTALGRTLQLRATGSSRIDLLRNKRRALCTYTLSLALRLQHLINSITDFVHTHPVQYVACKKDYRWWFVLFLEVGDEGAVAQ